MSKQVMRTKLLCLCLAAFTALGSAVALARQWKDRSGTHTVEAELVRREEDSVRLRKTDGREIVVPLNQLSKADQQYVQQQTAKAAAGTDDAKAVVVEPLSGSRLALLIGVNDYEKCSDLSYCAADVSAIGDQLVKIGFDRRDITLLADQQRMRPSRRNILEQLDATLQVADKDDLVIVALSGHGAYINGKSYFCPQDARPDDPQRTMVLIDDVYKKLEDCDARLKLLLVDACRNKFVPEGARSLEDQAKAIDGFAKSLADGDVPPGVVMLSSCHTGERSWEDDTFKHGVFTHFLLQGLQGKADQVDTFGKRDRWVSLFELCDYVQSETKRHVLRTRRVAQRPYYHTSPDLPDFRLVKVEGLARIPDLTRPSVLPPVAPADRYGRVTGTSPYELKRDSFETQDEWRARVEAIPRFPIGTVKLRKEDYDISTGKFPLTITHQDWIAASLYGPFVTLSRDDARAIFREAPTGKLTAVPRIADGKLVLAHPRVQIASRSLPLQSLDLPPQLTNSIGMKLNLIPAGEFQMGSPKSEKGRHDDEQLHRVKITQPFYLAAHEVTQGQWTAVMGTAPWKGKEYVTEGANHPATYVRWDDAQAFIAKLNRKEGKTYRLPTEAEWEYACRAGSKTAYHFGDDASPLGDYAWFDRNARNVGEKYAHRVGQKRPNAFSLYDMHGNVWEWCQDGYDKDYYAGSPTNDPVNNTAGSSHVLRGGSWGIFAWYCRSAVRGWVTPDFRLYLVGFRVVLSGR